MGWILMQPADDVESTSVMELLLRMGKCKFYLTKSGACLQLIGFGSRCFPVQDIKYHSFVGEAACV